MKHFAELGFWLLSPLSIFLLMNDHGLLASVVGVTSALLVIALSWIAT
jgi:hypothetical protein